MCGLTFLYDPAADPGDLRARSRAALHRLSHRGPDAEGLFDGAGWAIGHRRLSIIDLAGSPQPMADPTGRHWLAYNGELYNYRELRPGLEDRWHFTTSGDTEVILAGLVLEGPSFLQRMEGMWAIALWDSQEQRLTLVRDRMGKKPLYVQASASALACASELPALRGLANQPWSQDDAGIADYLRYGYCMPGHTAYHEVKEVLPGHVATWAPGEGGLTQVPYWTLTPEPFAGTREQAIAALRERLQRAVERRLVADVEVGAFLSGGIDSSLVCALVRKTLGRPLKTFTIGFPDAAFDERRYARIAAEALGTEHVEDMLEGWDEAELDRLVLHHVGQPFADSSLLPTTLVSQVAARSVKVVLSGDGGDELFSGYERYRARAILRWYTRLPPPLRRTAERAVRALPEPTAHHSRSLIKKAHLFMDIVARQQAETPYVAPLLMEPKLLARVAPEVRGEGHPPPGIPPQTGVGDIARMMHADALIYLPQDILVKVDRASMAHALEARAPFLDRGVLELAFSMPVGWHRGLGANKRALRDAFRDLLPPLLWRRRKQGFGVPIHAWFRGRLGDRLLDLARGAQPPVSEAGVRWLLQAHRAQGRDYGYRLWVIYALLLWQQHQLP